MVEGHNRGHSRGRCRRYGEGQLMATKWNWQKTFIWKEIPFTGTSWPSDTASHCILQCITPADFFELYISDAVIDTLVPETTKYDMQSMQQTPSNMTLSPLTKQETTVFLGLHIAMGLLTCQKSINTGWLNLLLKCDGICHWCCTTISQKSCANPHPPLLWHSSIQRSKPWTHPDYDNLHKVYPVLTAIHDNCLTVATQHTKWTYFNWWADAMRVSFIQYMTDKGLV